MAFFNRKKVEDAWESPASPTPHAAVFPLVKDVLKAQHLTVGDLTARNETVTISLSHTDTDTISVVPVSNCKNL